MAADPRSDPAVGSKTSASCVNVSKSIVNALNVFCLFLWGAFGLQCALRQRDRSAPINRINTLLVRVLIDFFCHDINNNIIKSLTVHGAGFPLHVAAALGGSS